MPPMASKPAKMEVDEKAEDRKKEETPELPPKDPAVVAYETIHDQLSAVDKGEAHLIGRVLQVLHKTRKTLTPELLHRLLLLHTAAASKERDELAAFLPPSPKVEPMETDSTDAAATAPRPKEAAGKPKRPVAATAEADMYVHLLVLLYLVDQKDYEKAKNAAEFLLRRIDAYDKRHMDGITAKALFYLALVNEKQGKLFSLRSYLNARLRSATLRRHAESQATLIYTLLRTYLIHQEYQTAAKLIDKVQFPANAGNNDMARYVYYRGRIEAMQLNYTAAMAFFQQAMRKAPQEAAIGFKQNAQKWIVVIGLLQGEIPERRIFRIPYFRKCLVPYLQLTHAVRLGDLVMFNEVVLKYGKEFERDETLTLIVRLRQNVIKTAVRQISLSYSRISIANIGKKLGIASDVETEYMVAKAISDGSIEASLTCGESGTKEAGTRFMQSAETADVYRTSEPQSHFDNRITYCLELHNQAVKALRYPPKTNVEVESIEQQREREQQELEYAKGMAEEDDDDF